MFISIKYGISEGLSDLNGINYMKKKKGWGKNILIISQVVYDRTNIFII